jgi:hypothetical protein
MAIATAPGRSEPARTREPTPSALRKVSLGCGIVSSLVYVAATIVGAARWEGYDSTSQTVSELFALGAPSRAVVVPLLLAYDVLLIAFGWGVWSSAGRTRNLRVAGGLLIGIAGVGLFGPPFASMHLRGTPPALSDMMHIVLTVVIALCTLLAVGFAATALGKQFRLYSIGTLLVLVLFGALAGLDGGRMAAQLPTPWLGVTERINIGGYLLWVAVLAIALLRRSPRGGPS